MCKCVCVCIGSVITLPYGIPTHSLQLDLTTTTQACRAAELLEDWQNPQESPAAGSTNLVELVVVKLLSKNSLLICSLLLVSL